MAITRRRFVGGGLATGAAVMSGAFSPLSRLTAAPFQPPSFLEATIPQLQALMNSGRLTSRDLTARIFARMSSLNPLLGAVIETNPEAVAIAAQRDAERQRGQIRGPLHGIPILLKDNIATDDDMQTTAGSLALVGSRVPRDAPIVSAAARRGRGDPRQGEPVASGRTSAASRSFNGWSARGGFTREPVRCSTSIPAARARARRSRAAANLCAAAVGTETDGSIVCPAGNNLVVGLKPTVGLRQRRTASSRSRTARTRRAR